MPRAFAICAGAVLLLCSCVRSTTYTAVPPSAVKKGHGGSFTTYDGIDVWTSGRPERPYRVVGIVLDDRELTGFPPSGEAKAPIIPALVAKARPAHPDALIIVSQSYALETVPHFKVTEPNTTPYIIRTDRDGNPVYAPGAPGPTYWEDGTTIQTLGRNWETKAKAIVYVQ